MRYIFIFSITFIFNLISFKTLAAVDYGLSVDESISGGVYLRIVNSDNASIVVTVSMDGESLDREQANNLMLFFLQEGVAYQLLQERHKTSFILTSNADSLNKVLAHFNQLFKKGSIKTSFIDLLIIGDVNQQKLLGKVYSQWSKLEMAEKPASEHNFQHLIDSNLKKNKQEYWLHIFTLLLTCQQEQVLTAEFTITDNVFSCEVKKPPVSLAAGEIANIRSDTLEWLASNFEDVKAMIPIILKFRQEESTQQLEEFSSYLPNLSIEKITSLYHELNGEELIASDISAAIKPDLHTIELSKKDFVSLAVTENTRWSFSWRFAKKIDVCSLLNCSKIQSRLSFQLSNEDGSWMFVEFAPSKKDKSLNFILDEIIKPLNIAQAFTGSHLLVSGPSNLNQVAAVINQINFIGADKLPHKSSVLPKMLITQHGEHQLCIEPALVASPLWASQIMTQYYWQYLSVKSQSELSEQAWGLFEASCHQSTDSSKPILPQAFIQQQEVFDLMKRALIQRVDTLDTNETSYLALSEYYQMDLKATLATKLEKLNFEEYQFIAQQYQQFVESVQ